MGKVEKPQLIFSSSLKFRLCFTHGFLEGAVEPAVVHNVLDGDRWILQVLKRIHQDEVQHDVVEVQVLHLARARMKLVGLESKKSTGGEVETFDITHSSCGQLHLRVLPVLRVLQEANHLFKHFLKSPGALESGR